MLPEPLAPLDPHKTRALTTIYAPRRLKTRKNKTAQTRMLETDVKIKPSLSPFLPLPAIGQKIDKPNTKVIVFDLNKNETDLESRSTKLHDMLKPLTPLMIHRFTRKSSLDNLEITKPQQLLRENTYDVIQPIYVKPEVRIEERQDNTSIQTTETHPVTKDKDKKDQQKMSPKSRFKKAAIQVAKLTSMPATGKLLCLRERETFNVCLRNNEKSLCLQKLPQSSPQNLDTLTQIFQGLEMNGRHRDKIKKENSWF